MPLRILKRILTGIGLAIAGLVLSFCAVDYHRTHSGPFGYFANLPDENSPGVRGMKAIDTFMSCHPTEGEMTRYLQVAGFECESIEPSRSRRFPSWKSWERDFGSKLTRHAVCRYLFGPPGFLSSRTWYIEAFVGPDMRVKGYLQGLYCGYCP